MKNERVYKLVFASVYPHYLKKTETKGHTKAELDTIICWLTGYTQKQLQQQIDKKVDLETFFAQAPQMNPNVSHCLLHLHPFQSPVTIQYTEYNGISAKTKCPWSYRSPLCKLKSIQRTQPFPALACRKQARKKL